MHRVLRPGGRAAVWEPINNAFSGYGLQPAKPDLSQIAAEHERVVAHSQERWEHRETMMGFDERDLVRWFVEAGFTTVRLFYEFNYLPIPQTRRQVLASIRNRPNPSLMSYEEAAREVLGERAEEHLAKYARLLLSQPTRGGGAVALLTARRQF